MLFFFLIEFCKASIIHSLLRNFSSFLLSLLKGAWVSNKLSIFERYFFIEKLTSFSSLHKVCSQLISLKSEINLLLSNFFQSRLGILDLVTGIFEKKSAKKRNCRRWLENVDVTLPDSISSEEVEFEKISIKVDVLEIFVGKNIRGNKNLNN